MGYLREVVVWLLLNVVFFEGGVYQEIHYIFSFPNIKCIQFLILKKSDCRVHCLLFNTIPTHSSTPSLISIIIVGLMIAAFASASSVLDRPDYLKQAIRAAQFVRTHLFFQDTSCLLRNAFRDSTGWVRRR